MDAFNYLSVMVSIVLGLGLTQRFAGIGNLVQIRRRVKLYWLHSLWVGWPTGPMPPSSMS